MKRKLFLSLLFLVILAAGAAVLHGCGTGSPNGASAPVSFYGAGS